jgi:hypothetical protein
VKKGKLIYKKKGHEAYIIEGTYKRLPESRKMFEFNGTEGSSGCYAKVFDPQNITREGKCIHFENMEEDYKFTLIVEGIQIESIW